MESISVILSKSLQAISVVIHILSVRSFIDSSFSFCYFWLFLASLSCREKTNRRALRVRVACFVWHNYSTLYLFIQEAKLNLKKFHEANQSKRILTLLLQFFTCGNFQSSVVKQRTWQISTGGKQILTI